MSKERIVRYKKGMKDRTDWARVNAMTDEDIDYSDCPETDEAFWASAKPGWPGVEAFREEKKKAPTSRTRKPKLRKAAS